MHIIPLYCMASYGTAWNLIVSYGIAQFYTCNCIVSYGIAWYCIVGFGARAVSRKTFIYFTVMIVKTEVCFEKTKPSVFGEGQLRAEIWQQQLQKSLRDE